MNAEEDNVAFLDRVFTAACEAHFSEASPTDARGKTGLTLPMRDWSRLDVLRGEPAWDLDKRYDPHGMYTENALEAGQWVVQARRHCKEAVSSLLRS